MKEETKKRINKLIIPFTTRTISLLGAATIMTVGLASCKKEAKKTSSDTNSTVSYSSEAGTIPGQSNTFDNPLNSSSVNSDENDINSEVSNQQNNNTTVTKPNSSTNSNTSSNNNTNNSNKNNNSSNQSSSSNTSKPATSTPSVTPSMPSTLTTSNINDVDVFKHFAENIYTNHEAAITYVGYWYNDKVYYASIDDSRFLILLLNSDYINQATYNTFFQSKSFDDINRISNFGPALLYYAGNADLEIHFDKIVVDNNKKEFLKLLHSAIKKGNVKQFVVDFFNGNQKYFNYQDDSIMDFFVNSVGYSLLSENDKNSIGLMNYYFDINERMETYIKDLYQKYNGKQYQKD